MFQQRILVNDRVSLDGDSHLPLDHMSRQRQRPTDRHRRLGNDAGDSSGPRTPVIMMHSSNQYHPENVWRFATDDAQRHVCVRHETRLYCFNFMTRTRYVSVYMQLAKSHKALSGLFADRPYWPSPAYISTNHVVWLRTFCNAHCLHMCTRRKHVRDNVLVSELHKNCDYCWPWTVSNPDYMIRIYT